MFHHESGCVTDRFRRICACAVLMWFAVLSCAFTQDVTLFKDDFSTVARGPLSSATGARTEYHYLPEAAPRSAWAVSNNRGWWSVRETDGDRFVYQNKVDEADYTHPMIVAGDIFWADYDLTVRFAPEYYSRQCGVVFRVQNDRCYYFFGVRGGQVVLKKVNHATGFHQPDETVLDIRNIAWEVGKMMEARVSLRGDRITARLDGYAQLSAVDSTFRTGGIGLTSNVPARFTSVEVTTTRGQQILAESARRKFEETEASLQARNPKPVVWKKIRTEGFGSGRSLRFGDMDGDGIIDVLIGQVLHHGPKDRNSEIGCLTAMTFEGRKLWQTGRPDPWKTVLTNDVAFQIHDIDRNGSSEVIYCRNFELVIADGLTGRVRVSIPTPETPERRYNPDINIFPHILGDCIYFCDLRGTGYDSDIILKDRYRYIWAYDDKLELLWKAECNTGHYPWAADTDGDGRDELLMGYTLFDDDGTVLWTLDGSLGDHADGVAILPFMPGEAPKVLCAASDEGVFFADLKGRIIKHHFIGHAQNPAVADFRSDMPGLEVVTINFWGNQGIVHFFDADGNLYHSFEPNQYGSMCEPVNWSGNSEMFFVHNANVDEGGVFDGRGRKVVMFPDDGHPDMCTAVLDIVGDQRDEIVVWDPDEIWVYTQNDNPRTGKIARVRKNPLYNESNYKTSVAIPE
ncbi:hypothetical protein JW948_06785 [bacterium]|nr:hypothetical protein [bacterium]